MWASLSCLGDDDVDLLSDVDPLSNGTKRVTGEMVINGVPQGAPNFNSWDIKNTGHIGRVGVNYLFNAPVVAKF